MAARAHGHRRPVPPSPSRMLARVNGPLSRSTFLLALGSMLSGLPRTSSSPSSPSWGVSTTGSTLDYGVAIAASGTSAVYGGYCNLDTTMGGFTVTRVGSTDACVGRVDTTTGAVQYFKGFGSTNPDSVLGVATDSTRAGYFTGALIVLGGAHILWSRHLSFSTARLKP